MTDWHSKSSIIGVDACPAGWVGVRMHLSDRSLELLVKANAREIFEIENALVAIDVPIGLPESGGRECDDLARERLGWPRRNSVFSVPIRPALNARSQAEASEITKAADGRRVSAQSFGIYPKIAEVDSILQASPQLQQSVFEIHPELSFWRWNNRQPMPHGKKTQLGKADRERLIEEYYGVAGRMIITMLLRRHYAKREVADDDIHDAFAALWTAERIYRNEAESLPGNPPSDAVGLPMRIVV